jgi:hypothetical protein
VERMHSIMEKVGPDLEQWLPAFELSARVTALKEANRGR